MEIDYLSGDILYRAYRIRYQCDGKELTLFLDFEQSKELVYERTADGKYSFRAENKPLDVDYLCGTLDRSESQAVVFFVDPAPYSRGGLFTSYMRFRLKGYAIFNGNCSSISVVSIICQSMQMFRFLSFSQKVEHSKGDGTITIAHSFNVSSTSQIAEFTLEKENILYRLTTWPMMM